METVSDNEYENVKEYDAERFKGDSRDSQYNVLCSFPGCNGHTKFVFRDYVNVHSSYYSENIRKKRKIYTKFSLTACKDHLREVNDMYFLN